MNCFEKSEILDNLVFSTYLGNYEAKAIEVNDEGYTYVSLWGLGDTTILKLSPNGSSIEYSWTMTNCVVNDIELDSENNLYATGTSDSISYQTVNAYDDTYHGGLDVIVFKLNSTGTGLNFSTYVGGMNHDKAWSLDIDESGNVYVAGWTRSSDFPIVNSYDSSLDGTEDAFFFRLNSTGNGLDFSSYLGGSDDEADSYSDVHKIAVDSTGHLFVSGITRSTDFPLLDAIYDSHSGGTRGYLSKFNETGNGLEFSSYLMDNTVATDIVIDNTDNVYIGGKTGSATIGFDYILSPPEGSSWDHSVVIKIANDGSSLIYSTAVGSGFDCYIDVDAFGNVFLASNSISEYQPPLVNPIIPDPGDYRNVLVLKLNSTGNGILTSTSFGGTEDDWSKGIAVDQNSSMYVIGKTDSDDVPLKNPYNSDHSDSFCCKMGDSSDNDNDSLTNYEELILGTDMNNPDSDSDLMPDGWEVQYNLNPLVNDSYADADSDLLVNLDEFLYGCNATNVDTDSDELEDGPEVHTYQSDPLDPDSDDDTLLDGYEVSIGTSPTNSDSDSDSMPDPWEDDNGLDPTVDDSSGDPDNDELINVEEFNHNTDPHNPDSDNDSLLDGEEVDTYGTNPLDSDSDDDELSDGDEVNTYSTNPLSEDSDGDSLSDYEEVMTYNTDPNNADTDGDGANDADEIAAGTDPLVSDSTSDSDQDGLSDAEEIQLGTDLTNSDTDSDGLLDGWEVARGLDPLQYTLDTGEGFELIVLFFGVYGGFIAIIIVGYRVGHQKYNLTKLKTNRIFIPGIILLIVTALFFPVQAYGPIDPGRNEIESGMSQFSFTVKESPFYTNRINIKCWYYMIYIETTTITISFTKEGNTVASTSLTIESTSPEQKNEYGYASINVVPDTYSVVISGHSVTTELVQQHIDGRNNDQILWDTSRLGIGAMAILLILVPFLYQRRKRRQIIPPLNK